MQRFREPITDRSLADDQIDVCRGLLPQGEDAHKLCKCDGTVLTRSIAESQC